MNLDNFLKYVKDKEFFETLDRVVEGSDIINIEKQLNITLTETYKKLILRVGWIGWFGESIFGVCDDKQDSSVLRTQSQMELHRKFSEQLPSMPLLGNIIAEIFGGGFCFLYSMESERAGQISAHAPDERYQEVQYWDSLEDYFDYLIQGVQNWHSVEQ